MTIRNESKLRDPSYVRLAANGELQKRAAVARHLLESCELCPRKCRARRTEGQAGACRTLDKAVVYGAHPHFGEESPLVGRHGSGTIFFSHCNLACLFCQNYEISAQGKGNPIDSGTLAHLMLELQQMECHNINFVSPSHVVPQILEAVAYAAEKGLHIPLVYNSGGYDAVETLQLLDGVIDIYMPDMKYGDAEVGQRLSGVPDYPNVNQAAVLEMHRQVGDLVLDQAGVARRGLLVRHLVLPGGLAGTESIARFLATEVSRNTYVNVMAQYRPLFCADQYPPINRRITGQEYREALGIMEKHGLWRLDSRQKSALSI